jgi:hypothetical protein
MEPAIRRPAPDPGSAPLPATSSATGEQAAAGSSVHQRDGRNTRLYWPGPSPRISQVGRSSPHPWIRTHLNPLSIETANRRMYSDMFRPLSSTPAGTTLHAQVATTCVPAGERPNKTSIFISGVSDTRAFLAWLRASCPSGLTAQIKGEKFMAVPSTADGFRAAVSLLRSLDGKVSVSFHTTPPEDRCVWLLVKNLGLGMPECRQRGTRIPEYRESRSCDPAVATRIPSRNPLPHPTT